MGECNGLCNVIALCEPCTVVKAAHDVETDDASQCICGDQHRKSCCRTGRGKGRMMMHHRTVEDGVHNIGHVFVDMRAEL